MKNLRQVFSFVFLLAGLVACDQKEVNPEFDSTTQSQKISKEVDSKVSIHYKDMILSSREELLNILALEDRQNLSNQRRSNGHFVGDLLTKQEFRDLGGWTSDWRHYYYSYKQKDQVNQLFNTGPSKAQLGIAQNGAVDVVAHNKAYYRRNLQPGADRMSRPGGNGLYWDNYRAHQSSQIAVPGVNQFGQTVRGIALSIRLSQGASGFPRDSWKINSSISNSVSTTNTSTVTKEVGLSIKIPFTQLLDDAQIQLLDDATISAKYSISNSIAQSTTDTKTITLERSISYVDNTNHLPKNGERECLVRVFATPLGDQEEYKVYSKVKGNLALLPFRGNFFHEWYSRKSYGTDYGQMFIKPQYRSPFQSSGVVWHHTSPIHANVKTFTYRTGLIETNQAAKCFDNNGNVTRIVGNFYENTNLDFSRQLE